MGRLFGTDGVRGVANHDLTCELAMKLGRAAAAVLINKSNRHPRVIIGKDTRLSSDMLENAMAAGLCRVGASVVLLGVVPTPAVAYLVEKYKADAGVMISASHNSYEYNGIKIFSGDGYKLPDDLEERIESLILGEAALPPLPADSDLGTVSYASNALRDYIDHVKSTVHFSLTGLEIALDCANGSSAMTAETLFTELGAKVHMLHDEPNGTNINDNCGSTHMESLVEYVKTHKVDAGIAFDGDADRCLAVDENGEVIDGDFIMAICGLDMKSRGKLNKDCIVGTIMTNLGFVKCCEANGIHFEATKVGDRYVLEEMLLENYSFGGEQSGHLIFRDFASTGDGQLTALQFLQVLRRSGQTASELASICPSYPQTLVNVQLANQPGLKEKVMACGELAEAVRREEELLGGEGRVLVRPSGTEPLIRVMVEAKTDAQASECAARLADLVKSIKI